MESKKRNKPFFHEKQWCADTPVKWIFLIFFLLIIGPLGIGMYNQLTSMNNKSYTLSPYLGYTLVFMITILLFTFLWTLYLKSYLEVTIDGEGIHYRFPVLIRKWRTVKKEQIARYELRKYRPVKEYGGIFFCGRRGGGHHNRGDAYIISGKMGLQIYFVNNKRVLFGTLRPDALAYAMKKMMNESERPNDKGTAIQPTGRKRGSHLVDKGNELYSGYIS